MALNALAKIFDGTLDLIPHIQERAMRYITRNYVMAERVLRKTDMTGFNDRKVSEYLMPRRATALSEDTAIPDTTLERTQKSSIAPKEIGERYRLSDRRIDTDLESIVSDVLSSLGKSIGDFVEADLFNVALDTFRGGTIGSTSTDYELHLPVQAQTILGQRKHDGGGLFHVIHRYQALNVMQDLIAFTGAAAGANLDFRNNAISSFSLPTFGNMNVAISDMLPRRVVHKFDLRATGGTIRLQVGSGSVIGENITAAITVSATAGTLLTNIQAGLDGLTMTEYYSGSSLYVVTGTDVTDMTITPPSDLFLDDDEQLRIAVDVDNPTLWGGSNEARLQKSAYDLTTTITADIYPDMDDVDMGVALFERSAVCKSLLFRSEAIVWDIREPLKAHFNNGDSLQGRSVEYSAYMKYGAGQWSPELGMFILTTANSPLAVGAAA